MQTVREPGFDDAHAAKRPDLGAEAAGGVRQLRGGRNQILLAGIEQHLALQEQISRVGLLIVDVGVRLAVEKLAVEIEPGGRVGGKQTLL